MGLCKQKLFWVKNEEKGIDPRTSKAKSELLSTEQK
jgi:hypothetical protein